VPFFPAPDGIRLHYEIEGSGPPLLLHLGAGADTELWHVAGYVEPLAKANTCILFDHRGHGKSDHPTTAAANHIDRYADDVAALVAHLGYSSVSYLGWSNAVHVGLKAADQHPNLFDALVLFGPLGRPPSPEQLLEQIEAFLAGLREKGWRYILDGMVEAEKFPVPEWFLDRVKATDIQPYMAWQQARPDWDWSGWDAMPKITAPTLFIDGELEDPDDVMGEAASLMPHARRIRIADRHHINSFLHVEFVAPLVLDFLGGVRAKERSR
jgi:pimeloyl-ACP methyl ester carboxylesterase